jgi:hypothetical protein
MQHLVRHVLEKVVLFTRAYWLTRTQVGNNRVAVVRVNHVKPSQTQPSVKETSQDVKVFPLCLLCCREDFSSYAPSTPENYSRDQTFSHMDRTVRAQCFSSLKESPPRTGELHFGQSLPESQSQFPPKQKGTGLTLNF